MVARTLVPRARSWFTLVGLGLILALAAPPSRANVPTSMNYQGYLTDLANTPRQGSFKMAFGIFADSTGGAALWSETYAAVSVNAGLFNVLLGTVSPLPATMFSGARLWLQTAVSDTTLAPRRPLVTVPYSFHARNADTAQVVLGSSTGDIAGQVQIACAASNAGVLVYIPGRSFVAFTGTSGTFDLSSVPPGTYALHVEASNPTRSADVANVVVTAGGTTNVGTISLGPNLATDPTNCGTCGNVCPPVANGTAACTAGVCGIGSCNSGFANCDGNAANGCEANLSTNLNNCGSCNTVCPPVAGGTETCTAGVCGFVCISGFRNCNGNAADGCEINVTNDATNCSACGIVCSFPNGSAACIGGFCSLGGCASGFGNCDGNPGNGCESNFSNDIKNCGSCGHQCGVGLSCVSGVCQ